MTDLSGISDAGWNSIPSMNAINMITAIFVPILFFGLILLFINSCCKQSKSKDHRELMTDLYVIGMIRKYAKEDGLDLDNEMKEMIRFQKLQRLRFKDLDKVVENELKERIVADNQAKIDAMKKGKEKDK